MKPSKLVAEPEDGVLLDDREEEAAVAALIVMGLRWLLVVVALELEMELLLLWLRC